MTKRKRRKTATKKQRQLAYKLVMGFSVIAVFEITGILGKAAQVFNNMIDGTLVILGASIVFAYMQKRS